MNKLVLDVGCGSKPKGNINLDINIGYNKHHQHKYNVKYFKNFIRASATHLPIRNKSIHYINASHILEHLINPIETLKEWKRVTKIMVLIHVPNNPTIEEFKEHLYSWSKVSLYNLLSLIFENVIVYPNAPISDLMKMRSLKFILRKGGYKKPLNRIIGKIFGFQLTAHCYINKKKRR